MRFHPSVNLSILEYLAPTNLRKMP
ncbi:hypothetical protein ACLK2F_09955 [Escherichia coli]